MLTFLREKSFIRGMTVVLLLLLLYFFFVLGNIIHLYQPKGPSAEAACRFLHDSQAITKVFLGPNPFKIAQLKTLDILYRLYHKNKPKPKVINDITVVAVDDDSYRKANKQWPWPRTMEVSLINKLREYGAKVIGFDFAFVGESAEKEQDLQLSEAIKEAGNTVIVSYFDPEGKQGYGFVNKLRDLDYYVRQSRLIAFTRERKIIDYSLEIKALCGYFGIPLENVSFDSKNNILTIEHPQGRVVIPLRKNGIMPLTFKARPQEFTVVPFWKAVGGEAGKELFKDKIVLVGVTREVFHDVYHTPLGLMSGTFLIANTLLTILSNDFLRDVPWWFNLILLLFFGLVTALCTYRLSALKGLVAAVALIYLFISFAYFSFFKKSYIADYFSPIFIVIVVYFGVSLHKYICLLVESANLKTQAITDSLTGLYLRRYLELKLQGEFEKAVKFNLNITVIMVDVDHIKKINETYGHQAGDLVLKNTASIISALSRKSDVLCRYGGEEFCVILTGTREEGASIYAERLRKRIEDSVLSYQDKTIKVTASFGIANFPNIKVQSAEQLLKCADQALYQAKETGRNRICIFTPQNPPQENQK